MVAQAEAARSPNELALLAENFHAQVDRLVQGDRFCGQDRFGTIHRMLISAPGPAKQQLRDSSGHNPIYGFPLDRPGGPYDFDIAAIPGKLAVISFVDGFHNGRIVLLNGNKPIVLDYAEYDPRTQPTQDQNLATDWQKLQYANQLAERVGLAIEQGVVVTAPRPDIAEIDLRDLLFHALLAKWSPQPTTKPNIP